MKKTLFTLLAGAALFTACKKDDDTASAQDRLTGRWQLTDFTRRIFVNSTNVTLRQYDSLSSCERDDLYLFNADKTLVRDEGDQKCRSTDPQTRSLGIYTLTANDTRLVMPNPDNPSQIDTLEVVELSGSTLRTRTVNPTGAASGLEDTKTYSKR